MKIFLGMKEALLCENLRLERREKARRHTNALVPMGPAKASRTVSGTRHIALDTAVSYSRAPCSVHPKSLASEEGLYFVACFGQRDLEWEGAEGG